MIFVRHPTRVRLEMKKCESRVNLVMYTNLDCANPEQPGLACFNSIARFSDHCKVRTSSRIPFSQGAYCDVCYLDCRRLETITDRLQWRWCKYSTRNFWQQLKFLLGIPAPEQLSHMKAIEIEDVHLHQREREGARYHFSVQNQYIYLPFFLQIQTTRVSRLTYFKRYFCYLYHALVNYRFGTPYNFPSAVDCIRGQIQRTRQPKFIDSHILILSLRFSPIMLVPSICLFAHAIIWISEADHLVSGGQW